MYSQRDEETHILKLIGDRTGRFLDIGAGDGKTFSNTAALVDRGWEGVLFEPAAGQFALLQGYYEDNPRLTLVRAAIDVGRDPIMFWESPDLLSTTYAPHYEHWKKDGQYSKPFLIWPMPVGYIFNHWGPFDFISIDTEVVTILTDNSIIELDDCTLRSLFSEVSNELDTDDAIIDIDATEGFIQFVDLDWSILSWL